MMKFKCAYCYEDFPLLNVDGRWFLAAHRVTSGGMGFACEGMLAPAKFTVVPEQMESLGTFIAEMDTKTPTASAAKPRGQESRPDDAIQKRFETFHANNPQVFDLLTERANMLKAQGRTRVSMSELWEWLRYDAKLPNSRPLDGTTKFKLSNDYRSRYARLLVQNEELAQLIELRELHAKVKGKYGGRRWD